MSWRLAAIWNQQISSFPPPLIGIWQIMYANMLRFSFAFFSLTIIDISYLF